MAREWDGIDDSITATLLSAVPPPYTIGAWIRPDSAGEGGLGRILSTGSNIQYRVRSDMTMQIFQGGADTAFAISTTAIAVNAWSAVFGMVRAGDLRCRMFSGSLQSKVAEMLYSFQNDGANAATSLDLVIGNDSAGGAFTFDGRIGHVCIWGRLLELSEMERFRQGLIPLGLLSYYFPLDSPIASNATPLLGGIAATVSGCTVAEGPPVLMGFGREFSAVLFTPVVGAIDLVTDDALHAHAADNVALTQTHLLVVDNTTHSHTADEVPLTQTHLLAIDDATHNHSVDAVVLTQIHELAVDDTTHSHVAGNVELVQTHVLVVADAFHAHSADNVTLITATDLVTDDAVHVHTADNVALTQVHILGTDDVRHPHTADQPNLAQTHVLIVTDAAHTHVADDIALIQTHLLAVDDALHAHAADNVTLAQVYNLVTVDAVHVHTAEQSALIQTHILVTADAFHVHTADESILVLVAGEVPIERTMTVLPERRTVIVAVESRQLEVSR